MKRKITSDSIIIRDDNDKEIICITEKASDGVMNFKVSGKLKADVSYDFEDELTAVASVCKRIDLDLFDVTYISAVALRALLSVQQLIDEDDEALLRITGINKKLLEDFTENGFDQLFIIENID